MDNKEEQDYVLQAHIEEAGYEDGNPKVRDMDILVRPGRLTGLIGPNGAGKSTTLKTILGLLPHSKAKIEFGGSTGKYAYVPEQPVFYETLTLWEHLGLAAAVYGIEETVFEQKANSLLDKFRMQEVRHHLPASFSKGMQQKMMLMIGFLTRPDVYIVDEPFIGLDPRATKDFLGLLEQERLRGAGVLMSTHVLDTAERICDDFILLSQGQVAASGSLQDIRNTSGLPEGTLFDCFDKLT
ncbi:ABC transporter ATP-binding protein [Paenibacillus sp. J22TS3]|uniref:ABC transporter ATP-binding protein n=1 Tax=Paenibacillus sp. J22TS3 TaxID=2807192 RepID=UPI001B1063EF|nr:ABC transporter ATP-binding protein [Paenibacillus sp. J22TS3]GIP23660.1 multidrug ABC transporter ATP-binding protein [Paenibacillus sp. J22TS3]